jgi:hypothetical protein
MLPYKFSLTSTPLNNVNGSLVNIDSSTYPGSAFSNTKPPSLTNPNVMPEPRNNLQAAAAYIPCSKGGKPRRKKINNISNMYKMKGSRKTIRRHVRKIKSRVRSKYSRSRHTRKAGRKMKGGYSQYQNNMPQTQVYSTGGVVSPALSALANPVPHKVLNNCVNCVDNYNHYKNSGFPSKGWH